MPAIYPSTALKNQQLEIKAIAEKEPVYITENGRGKYIFAAEEVLQARIDEAVSDALYELHASIALDESRDDFAKGRYYDSRESLMEAVARKRAAHA